MGSNCVQEARHWLQQKAPAPKRLASLIARCMHNDMVPKVVKMSSDLFVEMIKEVNKISKSSFDLQNLPKTLKISLGNHELELQHDSNMPEGSMHATKS